MNEEHREAMELVKQANDAYQAKNFESSLGLYQQAFKLYSSDSIKKWIQFLEKKIVSVQKPTGQQKPEKMSKAPKHPTLLMRAIGMEDVQKKEGAKKPPPLPPSAKRIQMSPPVSQAEQTEPVVESSPAPEPQTTAPKAEQNPSPIVSVPAVAQTPAQRPNPSTVATQPPRERENAPSRGTDEQSYGVPFPASSRSALKSPPFEIPSIFKAIGLGLLLSQLAILAVVVMMMMQLRNPTQKTVQWEYKIAEVSVQSDKSNAGLPPASVLNRFGGEGWELLKAVPETSKNKSGSFHRLVLLLKRRVR